MSDVAKREDDKRWAVLRVEMQQQIDVKWQRFESDRVAGISIDCLSSVKRGNS